MHFLGDLRGITKGFEGDFGGISTWILLVLFLIFSTRFFLVVLFCSSVFFQLLSFHVHNVLDSSLKFFPPGLWPTMGFLYVPASPID